MMVNDVLTVREEYRIMELNSSWWHHGWLIPFIFAERILIMTNMFTSLKMTTAT